MFPAFYASVENIEKQNQQLINENLLLIDKLKNMKHQTSRK